MGTNKCASQAGMSAYGTRRHLYDPKAPVQAPMDNTTISLQMGTNKGASQVLHHAFLKDGSGNEPQGTGCGLSLALLAAINLCHVWSCRGL